MKNKIILVALLSVSTFFSSCEKVIDVETKDGKTQLVVDAFLTNESGEVQEIHLMESIPYFENEIRKVTTATVKIVDDLGNEFSFLDPDQDGTYTWQESGKSFSSDGGKWFELQINYNNEDYVSGTEINPVPLIDEIRTEVREEGLGEEAGIYAELMATDIAQRKDFYWIQYYRNDSLMSNPNRIIVVEDAAFSGDGTDGFLFIIPIRESITDAGRPYEAGENLKVELKSIDLQTYSFLTELRNQTTNQGLFATPIANVRTNIENSKESGEKAVGWFIISNISKAEVTF